MLQLWRPLVYFQISTLSFWKLPFGLWECPAAIFFSWTFRAVQCTFVRGPLTNQKVVLCHVLALIGLDSTYTARRKVQGKKIRCPAASPGQKQHIMLGSDLPRLLYQAAIWYKSVWTMSVLLPWVNESLHESVHSNCSNTQGQALNNALFIHPNPFRLLQCHRSIPWTFHAGPHCSRLRFKSMWPKRPTRNGKTDPAIL